MFYTCVVNWYGIFKWLVSNSCNSRCVPPCAGMSTSESICSVVSSEYMWMFSNNVSYLKLTSLNKTGLHLVDRWIPSQYNSIGSKFVVCGNDVQQKGGHKFFHFSDTAEIFICQNRYTVRWQACKNIYSMAKVLFAPLRPIIIEIRILLKIILTRYATYLRTRYVS